MAPTTTTPKGMSRAEAARLDLYDVLDRIEQARGQHTAYAAAAAALVSTFKEYPAIVKVLDPDDVRAYVASAAAGVRLKQASDPAQTALIQAEQVHGNAPIADLLRWAATIDPVQLRQYLGVMGGTTQAGVGTLASDEKLPTQKSTAQLFDEGIKELNR